MLAVAYRDNGIESLHSLWYIWSSESWHNVSPTEPPHIMHLIVVYEVEQSGGKLLISHESTALRFFDVDALPEGMMPSSRMRVLDTLWRRVEAFSK